MVTSDDRPAADSIAHPASWDDERLYHACEVRFQRRSGPGGQHRNKVETAVTLTHRETGLQGSASERRQQSENLQVALGRLRVQLALQLRLPWTHPSHRWTSRCGNGQLRVSIRHRDHAALLAEALDALAAHDWQLADVAERLACSRTQLVRFLQREPAALRRLNDERQLRGAPPLRPS